MRLFPAPILAAAALAATLPGRAFAGERMTGPGRAIIRHAAPAAGSLVASASLSLNSTVGETGSGSFSGGAIRLQTGLMPIASQPGSVVSITTVTKSTGDMELTWLAAGLDGFQGGVVSGFYRLDYSSDPAHAFGPTTYSVEFATNVVPGSLQQYRLSGLEPNTTYYAKIYLADARKYFAEDSARSDQSTLAHPPVAPVFAAVNSSSVTITWTLPAGLAARYNLNSSTTNFGTLFPGGAVISSNTPDGTVVSLTLGGLEPRTTYFFRVASLNWQSEKTFAAVISTMTRGSPTPRPVLSLAAAPNALGRTVMLTWNNDVFEDQNGVLVVLSTNPSGVPISDGTPYFPGQVLPDASVVKSTSAHADFADSGLVLDSTYYYHLFAGQRSGPAYAVSVSTRIFLDLPPMSPAGFNLVVTADKSKAVLTWSPVHSNNDGSLFPSTGSPRSVELSYYAVQRATSIIDAGWVTVGTVPMTSQFFTDNLPDPNRIFAYRVLAVDAFGTYEASLAMGTDRTVYAVADDQVTSIQIPSEVAQELSGAFNNVGVNIVIRVKTEAPNVAERVLKSVTFEAYTETGEPSPGFKFSKPGAVVALKYDVEGGQIVPSPGKPVARPSLRPAAYAPAGAAAQASIPATDIKNRLGMYWHNGSRFTKLFGKVNPQSQTVSVQTGELGAYQIRTLQRSENFNFDAASGLSNKAITPNGDGLNDNAVFTFENPKDSGISGQIFDVSGSFVADLIAGPLSNQLRWDGRAGGRAVPGGVYVYQLRAEGKVFNGTVVVVR